MHARVRTQREVVCTLETLPSSGGVPRVDTRPNSNEEVLGVQNVSKHSPAGERSLRGERSWQPRSSNLLFRYSSLQETAVSSKKALHF